MFTGLIQALGTVQHTETTDSGRRITIDCASLPSSPAPGDSVAVNGCCLTVAQIMENGVLAFDAIPETLRMTTIGRLRTADRVNLETSVTASTPMGGHFVQGHVDGIARVCDIRTDSEYRIRVTPPAGLMPMIIPKGSVTVAGVSLTVASVSPAHGWFEVALIPTTLGLTNLGDLGVGDEVNIETDMLVRSMLHVMHNYASMLAPSQTHSQAQTQGTA